MRITRREFFKYCTIAAGALGLTSSDLLKLKNVMAKPGATPVIWLQGASCTGDTTSLLNSIFYTDPVGLLIANADSAAIDLRFHQTAMNASGQDFDSTSDAISAAQALLSGVEYNTYAIWSSDTWSIGKESIKLKIADRSDIDAQAYAEITPESLVVVNELDFCFKMKLGESQAPFVEVDVENQDTGQTATLLSCYPEEWSADCGRFEPIVGPKDWTRICLSNFPYWQASVGTLETDDPHGVSGVGPPPVATVSGQPEAPTMIWAASTNFQIGDIIMAAEGCNMWWYRCVADATGNGSGLTGATPPTFGTSNGATFTDGDLTWRTISACPLLAPQYGWTGWTELRGIYGTWEVKAVRIINQGNPAVQIGAPNETDSCTIYIDDIFIAGVFYEDESDYIHLWPGIGGATGYVLAVEGSVVTGKPTGIGVTTEEGQFCEVGPMVPGSTNETMLNAFLTYARNALAVLAIGTCASYGGVPGMNKADKTGAKGCAKVLKEHGIKTPVINVPGCPAHPDWIVGTIVAFIAQGLDGIALDNAGRPRDFYGGYVCNGNQGNIAQKQDIACPWRYNNDGFINATGKRGEDNNQDDAAFPIGESRGLAKYKWGSVPVNDSVTYNDETTGPVTYAAGHMFEGCLGVLGCRGRKTHADCAYRKWNAATTMTPGTLGVNWCVGSRGGCQGCTEPDFPTLKRFYTFI